MAAFRYSQPHEPHYFTEGANGYKSPSTTSTTTNSPSMSLSSSASSVFLGGILGPAAPETKNDCLDTMTQKIDDAIFRVLKLRGASSASVNPMSEASLSDQASQMLVKYFVPMPRDIALRIEALVQQGNLSRVDNGAILLRYAPVS